MIIVEQRLSDAFDQLPTIDGFKPVYDWGNKFQLLALLKSYENDKKSPYPLVYQLSNDSTQEPNKNTAETRLRLILATRNLQTELLNRNRWAMSYRNVLFPLVTNIEKVILRAGIFNSLPVYRLYTHPNYGNQENENFTADIWDALEMEFTEPLIINNSCINTQIKF